MLEVRSANLMDLAACLPRPAERLDTRYQWIKRLLANTRVVSDAVMAPYGREVLGRLSAGGQRIVLLIDQTQANERHQAVMVAVRHADVGYVAMLRESSVVLGAFIGWRVLQEPMGGRRLASSGVVLVAMVALIAVTI